MPRSFKVGDRVRLLVEPMTRRWVAGDFGAVVLEEGQSSPSVKMDIPSRSLEFPSKKNMSIIPGRFELVTDEMIIQRIDGSYEKVPRETVFQVGDRVRRTKVNPGLALSGMSGMAPIGAVGTVTEAGEPEKDLTVVLWDEAEYRTFSSRYTVKTTSIELLSRTVFSPGDRVKRINDVGEGYKTTPYARLNATGKIVRRDTSTDNQWIVEWDDARYNWTKNYVVASHEIRLLEKAPPPVPRVPTVEERVGKLRHGGFLR